jgi:hypothetical protein
MIVTSSACNRYVQKGRYGQLDLPHTGNAQRPLPAIERIPKLAKW